MWRDRISVVVLRYSPTKLRSSAHAPAASVWCNVTVAQVMYAHDELKSMVLMARLARAYSDWLDSNLRVHGQHPGSHEAIEARYNMTTVLKGPFALAPELSVHDLEEYLHVCLYSSVRAKFGRMCPSWIRGAIWSRMFIERANLEFSSKSIMPISSEDLASSNHIQHV